MNTCTTHAVGYLHVLLVTYKIVCIVGIVTTGVSVSRTALNNLMNKRLVETYTYICTISGTYRYTHVYVDDAHEIRPRLHESNFCAGC